MNKKELADHLHNSKYNCAQAVACTYCDLVGVDEETMFKMTEALGLGMGCMDGTCGAVAGACILAGMKRSTGNLEKPDSKAESYKLSRAILGGFEKANGTAICKELKGIETGKVIKSCDDCIKEAAALAEHPGLPVVFSGGVASNSLLRGEALPFETVFAASEYSTDNAMGIALLAWLRRRSHGA